MDELKACPFCDGEIEFRDCIVYPNGEKSPAFIKCKKCNYHIASFDTEELIKLWNSRPSESKLMAKNAELINEIATDQSNLINTYIEIVYNSNVTNSIFGNVGHPNRHTNPSRACAGFLFNPFPNNTQFEEETMKDLLTSRKFWAALILLVVVVVSAFYPNFHLDAEHAAGYAVVIVAYIVGVAVDPGPGGWRGVILSRKWWAAVIGFLVITLDGFGIGLPYGLTAEQLVTIALAVGGYIAGVSLEKRKMIAG
jgi:hypothetical protein